MKPDFVVEISRHLDPEMQHIRRNAWIEFAKYSELPTTNIVSNVMIRTSSRYEWREWLAKVTPYPIEFEVDDGGYTLSIRFETEADKVAFLLRWK